MIVVDAIGDGVADDTAAIQAAASAAAAAVRTMQPPGGSYEAWFPPVVFRPGRYRITQPINWGAYAKIVTDGSAIIENAGNGPSFVFNNGYIVGVSGLTFIGGVNGIEFVNQNTNGAKLVASSCRFQKTTGPAVYCHPVTGDDFSSLVSLESCKWTGCAQALKSWAILNVINGSGTWLQWEESVAAINAKYIELVGGRLNMTEAMLVPWFPGGANGRRWIGWRGFQGKHAGTGVFCDRVSFHGEAGGLPPVTIASSPDIAYPFQGATVSLRDSQLSCGQTLWPDTAVINYEGGIAQTVIVDGCSGVQGPCPLIRDPGGGEGVFLGLQNGPNRVRILLGANGFYPLTPGAGGYAGVPSYLTPYLRTLAGELPVAG